jgi:hypothetical protein
MVRGLDLFRDYFKDYTDKYILIGGTACDLAMENMGLDFRATKDLDIVLVLEALDVEFVNAFRGFIKEGQYKNRQKSTGKKLFYRFYDPEEEAFPYMIELFSRKPDVFELPFESHLTPIPIDETVSSLSAILMDNDYYDFIKNGQKVTDDLSIISQEYLIPLKSRAWLDLCKIKSSGETIDSKDIKKHKNDVFRLYQILSLDTDIALPQSIADDMRVFLDKVSDEPPDLKNLGIRNTSLAEIIGNLKKIYKL